MTTPQEMLQTLKTNYTIELHNWLKIQYMDVCSDGDIIINNILNQLNKYMRKEFSDNTYTITTIDNVGDRVWYFVEHIYSSYNDYLDGNEPNPWWAD